MRNIEDLKVQIFADGAELDGIIAMSKHPLVQGFTTNPSLISKTGEKNYEDFARRILAVVPNKPISFEVLSDDFDEMILQGRRIASWGANVNAKVPVINTKGDFSGDVIATLSNEGVSLNITAVFTPEQVKMISDSLAPDSASLVSVFAGRIADTGTDPIPILKECIEILKVRPKAKLLWASAREPLNIFQANDVGCHIITVPNNFIDRLVLVSKDLNVFSRETVEAFYKDSIKSGFRINTQ